MDDAGSSEVDAEDDAEDDAGASGKDAGAVGKNAGASGRDTGAKEDCACAIEDDAETSEDNAGARNVVSDAASDSVGAESAEDSSSTAAAASRSIDRCDGVNGDAPELSSFLRRLSIPLADELRAKSVSITLSSIDGRFRFSPADGV